MAIILPEKAIYYDKNYTTSWIAARIARDITSFLSRHNFSVLNAIQLRNFVFNVMEKKIENAVVVFSMDIAPDTVLDDVSANCLIRQFLDAGGRIVWIGDVPFWHIGRKGIKTVDEHKEKGKKEDLLWYQKGAQVAVLGVNPVIATVPAETVNITREGKAMGLRLAWSGARPVEVPKELGSRLWWKNIRLVIRKGKGNPKSLYIGSIPKDRGMLVLAESKYLIARPLILLKKRWRLQIRKAEITLPPKIEIGPGRAEEARPEAQVFWKRYANAWFKNFNKDKPLSGFIRIWDYVPKIMTENMLEELLSVATFGLENQHTKVS